MQKVSSIVLYVLITVSLVLAGLFYFGGTVDEAAEFTEPVFTALNLSWAYILFIGAVVITLLFSIVHIITHPKALKGALITLVIGVVLVGIAYFIASDAPVGGRGAEETTAETLKWTGTILWTTWILGGVAILSIIVSEIYRALS